MQSGCVHHWMLESGGSVVGGVCKKCGQSRTFAISYEDQRRSWSRPAHRKPKVEDK
ncbi:MAG TPA: hypothetical protein VFZ12_04605 [Dehalococcoidia bacterium]|nr:hypothetical protein [Dehalococcoidia bacterium]